MHLLLRTTQGMSPPTRLYRVVAISQLLLCPCPCVGSYCKPSCRDWPSAEGLHSSVSPSQIPTTSKTGMDKCLLAGQIGPRRHIETATKHVPIRKMYRSGWRGHNARDSVQISVGTPSILTEDFRDFSRFLQAIARILP